MVGFRAHADRTYRSYIESGTERFTDVIVYCRLKVGGAIPLDPEATGA